MGAININAFCSNSDCNNCNNEGKDCIVAFKVYDQCRIQLCLTPSILGPARASETKTICGETIHEGDVIIPPCNSGSVSIDNLKLKKIFITDKTPNAFRPGYWDVEIKFLFAYRLIFRTSENCDIGCIWAHSVYKTKITLFGSIGTNIVFSTDLFCGNSDAIDADPFVSVEGKAVALAAALKYCTPRCGCECNGNCGCGNNCGCNGNCNCRNCECLNNCDCNDCCRESVSSVPIAVLVTIGLFAIVKIYRIVNLLVHSEGCCLPEECAETASGNDPCDAFNNMDFPLDIFCPPWGCNFKNCIDSEDDCCDCGNNCRTCGNNCETCGNNWGTCGNNCGTCGNNCGTCGNNNCGCRH